MPSTAVIATWVLTAGWLVLLGSPAAALTFRRFGWLVALRAAVWFGLAGALLLLLVTNFFVPLRSTTAVVLAAVAAVTATVIAAIIGMVARKRPSPGRLPRRGPFTYWSLVIIAALAFVMIAVAHASFGAANQWDAGLYHLNAIQYASEYRVIPGLANLHDRFGVTNGQHLLTALLSNTGWGIDAFRLQVGFFVFLFGVDLALRLLETRKGAPWVGTIIMLLAIFGLIPFLLGNPDELITSPSPDSVALLLTVIGGAYLADGMASRRTEYATVGIVVLAAAASVRTQLWAFLAMAVIVVLIAFWRRSSPKRRPRALTMVGSGLAAALLVASQTRDAIQSGWLLFPLDLLPLPVDWKAFDPAASRMWIVSWARTPGAAPEEVMGNWSWVGEWLTRSAGDWGIRLALGLLALALTLWLAGGWKGRNIPSGGSVRPEAPLWLLVPVVAALGLWFLSAPDPRFAWGQIVLLGAIPAAVALTGLLAQKAAPVAAAIAALAVAPAVIGVLVTIDGATEEGEAIVTFSGVPWTISAALEPVPSPELAIYTLPTGQELITPTADDRCWTAFPLCRPYPNDSLLFRGESIQDGFASRLWTE